MFSKIVIYEQRDTVGGIWNYTPLPPKWRENVNGDTNQAMASNAVDVITANLPKLNTPMYEGLESNLPHMVMQFSDTPFPEGTHLFPMRDTVLRYLQDYASDIISMIRFNHQVLDVRPTSGKDCHGWEVTVRATAERENKSEKFDAVIAANGHCDWPMLPNIEGLDAWSKEFPESLYHSVSYKNAKVFENKVSEHLVSFFLHFLSQRFQKGNFTDVHSVSFLWGAAPPVRTSSAKSPVYANILSLSRK